MTGMKIKNSNLKILYTDEKWNVCKFEVRYNIMLGTFVILLE